VTKVVNDKTIRGFYAITILAGFVNRLFSLPAKLGSMDLISISKGTGAMLNQIGTWAFFIVVGIFGLWVFTVFFKNLKTLRGKEVRS